MLDGTEVTFLLLFLFISLLLALFSRHVHDRKKCVLIPVARRQHYRLTQEAVNSLKDVHFGSCGISSCTKTLKRIPKLTSKHVAHYLFAIYCLYYLC